MNDKSIPVYIDCNYEDIKLAIAKISDLKIETASYKLLSCITDELKARYNGGALHLNEFQGYGIESLISNLSIRMGQSLKSVEKADSSMLEYFRDYVERALNYTAPIDRSQYPHLTDEMINELYNYILESDRIYSNYPEFEELNQRIEAFELVFSRCNIKDLSYYLIKDLYVNASGDKKQKLHDMLENVRVRMPSIPQIHSYEVNFDEFSEIINMLESKNNYDEQTILTISNVMHMAKDGDVIFSEDIPLSLTFGDIKIDIPISKLLNYCTANTFVKPTSFNYYNLFSDYLNNDILEDSKVKFNLNGIDFDLTVKQLKEAIKIVDTNKYIGEFTNKVSASDAIQTRFMGCLCKLLTYNHNDYDDKKIVNIYGRKINVSVHELLSYLDNDGDIDIKKMIDSYSFKELERVRLKNLLPYEDSILRLSDLNIVGHGKALDFFHEYGSVWQTNLNVMGLYHVGEDETERLIHFCMDKYGFSEDEAYLIMRSIGRRSGCTAVAACNTIYELYDYDAEKFQNDFGYPMFIKKQMDDGQVHEVLNGDQLFLDMTISASVNGNTDILHMNNDGTIIINNEYLEQNKSGTQTFLDDRKFFFVEFGDNGLNQFLKDRNNDILDHYSVRQIGGSASGIHDMLISAINDNKIVGAGIGAVGDYEMYEINESFSHIYSGAHAVTVSGVTEEGVLVNSWGALYYVPLKNIDVFRILEKNVDSGGV